jgi:VanZ family protein
MVQGSRFGEPGTLNLEPGASRLAPKRFALALTASVVLVLSAPFMGEARSWLRATFPGHFVAIVGGGVALAALIAVAVAIGRIREHRAARYALVAAAVLLAVGYSARSSIGNPESDVVEHVHFIEYGIVTWLFYRAWLNLGDAGVILLPLLAGLAVGTCEEWFQWFLPARVGELRDIFLNGAAIVSGLLLSVAILPPGVGAGVGRRSLAHLFGVGALLAALLAGFVNSVHLGHEIADPDGGTFRSIYTAAELEALSRERAREWASDPPTTRPPRLSREDQYMSEGLLHVQERNRRWAAADATAAWFENRILEKYFAPVLDTPSYVSRTGHRWPAAQRLDAGRRAARDPRAFRSAAQGDFPIFTWPRPLFLAMSAVVVVLLALAAAVFARRGDG